MSIYIIEREREKAAASHNKQEQAEDLLDKTCQKYSDLTEKLVLHTDVYQARRALVES